MAERKPAKKGTQKSANSTSTSGKASKVFTDEERAAIRDRAQELQAATDKAVGEGAVLAKIAEVLVRDARVCQGWQDRLLLPTCAEVQDEVRDVRLQRRGKSRRRHPVAGR